MSVAEARVLGRLGECARRLSGAMGVPTLLAKISPRSLHGWSAAILASACRTWSVARICGVRASVRGGLGVLGSLIIRHVLRLLVLVRFVECVRRTVLASQSIADQWRPRTPSCFRP